MRKNLAVFLALTLILVSAPALLGCLGNENPGPEKGTIKGITLTPRSFEGADFTDFFLKAKQAGDIVSWAGDWNELNVSSGAPRTVAELASTYDYTPMIEAQFFAQSTRKLLRPLDNYNRTVYKSKAVEFAQKYKPKYLALGIEVNILYEKAPQDFENFTSFYSEVYDAVKAVSPQTMVFTIFQLEKMKGFGGGLFGGENDAGASEWQLLERFPKMDVIAFTTYPCLIYKNPDEIPADYYSEIQLHTSKPVIFTEIGWHSASSPVGWESSEAEQKEFVARFFNLTAGLEGKIAIWSFMYDQNVIEPFNMMGLRRSDGSAKQAWEEWINAK
jgi:hypothetical protein